MIRKDRSWSMICTLFTGQTSKEGIFMQTTLLDYIKSGEYNIKGCFTIKKEWETVYGTE